MDKHMYQYISILLGLCSMMVPGSFVSVVCLVIAIGMLGAKISVARQSAQGFENLMMDIISVIIVIVINVVISLYCISIEANHKKYDYNVKENIEDITVLDLAEGMVQAYKMENLS